MLDSPRVFTSTNPWKITATFQAVSSTKEEYLAAIEGLKATAPAEPKKGVKRTKLEQAHLALVSVLEGRIEAIDADLAVSMHVTDWLRATDVVFANSHIFRILIGNIHQRVAKVKKRIEQRKSLLAQAEIRETRTRRQTQKPDYVYADQFDSEVNMQMSSLPSIHLVD